MKALLLKKSLTYGMKRVVAWLDDNGDDDDDNEDDGGKLCKKKQDF